MFQEGITAVLHLTETKRNSEWYIQALEFMGEHAPSTSLDDEFTYFEDDDNTQSIHLVPC